MTNEKTIDIDKILTKRGEIAVVWSIDDVLAVRPDLTKAQAWEVLENAKAEHDAGLGISWATLEVIAEQLFGSL